MYAMIWYTNHPFHYADHEKKKVICGPFFSVFEKGRFCQTYNASIKL